MQNKILQTTSYNQTKGRKFFLLFPFLFLLLNTSLFSNHLVKKANFINNNRVYSTDLIDTDKRFLLVKFERRNVLQLSFHKLKKIFKSQGIEISSKSSVIYLYKINKKTISSIREKIKNLYESKYSNLTIKKIDTFPRSGDDIEGLKLIDININENSLKRTKGVLKASFGIDGEVIKKVSFGYELTGLVNSFVAKRRILYGDTISFSNVDMKYTAVKNSFQEQISTDMIGNISAKVTINQGSIILKNRVKKLFDVKKSTRIKALLKEGSVEVEFYLNSKENGYIGDTIQLINNNNKKFVGEIIEKNMVLLK
ncbi:MAG: flagellar basal body P-ring formation chaperone FlgA [Campylobacterales bacterium]|nr:flagellar basal body P-ring formation chaperone FlgA [Campylobacterales bacterium]